MTKTTAIERITKAEETIVKKQGTIARYEKTMVKKIAELSKKYGVTYEGNTIYCNELEDMGLSKDDAWTAYWIICDIRHCEEGITNAEKAITETTAKLDGYRKALVEAEQRERILENDIPESMKQAKDALVEDWTTSDITTRNRLEKAYKEIGYTAFVKKFRYSAYEMILTSDEDFRKQNEKEATMWLLDLYNRVKKITGNITDCGKLSWGGKALNGYVKGDRGSAYVETIEAGGWNIQRWHLRVLVNECKERA